jgi:hypothetical protein
LSKKGTGVQFVRNIAKNGEEKDTPTSLGAQLPCFSRHQVKLATVAAINN